MTEHKIVIDQHDNGDWYWLCERCEDVSRPGRRMYGYGPSRAEAVKKSRHHVRYWRG